MSDSLPQFEVEDDLGASTMYTGTVGTSAINLPSSPGMDISSIIVRCLSQSPLSKRLLYSFDGGITFDTLIPGESIGIDLRGRPKQIQIKGNVAGVLYTVIINQQD